MPATIVERSHGSYLVTTDRSRVGVRAVHHIRGAESYRARARPLEVRTRAIEHRHPVIGAQRADGVQAGFARMVTGLATFGWLADVHVLAGHRGGDLGTAMVRTIVGHPDGVDVRWQLPATAHGLYARFGCTPIDEPARWMRPTGPGVAQVPR